MRCTIEYRGVPLGHVTVASCPSGRVVAPFVPLPAYTALQEAVRRASVARLTTALAAARADGARAGAPATVPLGRQSLHAHGITAATLTADAGILTDAAALSRTLELRGEAGELVPTRYIEAVEPLRAAEPIAAILSVAEAFAPVPARVPAPPPGEPGMKDPGAP